MARRWTRDLRATYANPALCSGYKLINRYRDRSSLAAYGRFFLFCREGNGGAVVTSTRVRRAHFAPNRAALPAKLTRPQVQAVVPRERAFRRLDAPGMRWSWIAAPAGAGKTTLVSSWIEERKSQCLWLSLDAGDGDPATLFHYLSLAAAQLAGPKDLRPPPLTPEFLPGLDVYARRFFEFLFGLYPKRVVMVIDNCHAVPLDAPFAGVIVPALVDSLPDGGQLLCLSRGSLPAALARCSVDPGFELLGWEDLSFTNEEARQLAALVAPTYSADVNAANQYVNGWVAGLKLVLRAGPEQIGRLPGEVLTAPQSLFDYFAEEVLRRAPPDCEDFLLRSAVLSEMDRLTAAAVTGREDAAGVLAHLFDERLFIERLVLPAGPSYRFHRLFREFLLVRLAQQMGGAAVAQLKRRAAMALEQSGQLEAATILAFDCGDSALLSRLILAQAPLLARVGRLPTLARWLDAAPESIRAKDGWLSYWSGVAHTVSDAALGRTHLEQVYEQFQACRVQQGMWLAAAGMIGNLFLTWGSEPNQVRQWIGIFEALRLDNGGAIPEDVELQVFGALCAMVGHCPELALSRHLAERARVLAPHVTDANLRWAIGGVAIGQLTWQGDDAAAWALIDELQWGGTDQTQTTLASLSFDVWHSILLWERSEHESCFKLLAAARERCRHAGLRLFEPVLAWAQAMCALSAGDALQAGRFVQETLDLIYPQQVLALQLCRSGKAMQLGLAGRTAEGAALAREMMTFDGWEEAPSQAAFALSCLTSALLEAGALEEASACALRALELAKRLPSDRWVFQTQMLRAGIELERGAERCALERLREALPLAARRDLRGGVSLFQRPRTARLLALALRENIEPEYLRQLIRTRRLAAPPQLPPGIDWPVRLQIQLLGHFALLIDGKALERARSSAHKPLEVLKALVGMGPVEVSLSALEAAVWPELEGDAARNACHVAMHRLRKVLGDDSAIEVDQGVASLNMTDAWVDAQAFRGLALRVHSCVGNGACSRLQAEQMAKELMTVYPGHFLPGEEQPWAIGVREQLRSRFVQATAELSQMLERTGALEAAVELNRHGIALDPHAESFHNGLMRALIALGRRCEAKDAFERCRELLWTGLGMEPSAETRKLHARINGV